MCHALYMEQHKFLLILGLNLGLKSPIDKSQNIIKDYGTINNLQNIIKDYGRTLNSRLAYYQTIIQSTQQLTRIWTQEELQNFKDIRTAYKDFADNWETIKDLDVDALKEKILLAINEDPRNEYLINLLRSVIVAKTCPKAKPHEFIMALNSMEHQNPRRLLNLKKNIEKLASNQAKNKNSTNNVLNRIAQTVKGIVEKLAITNNKNKYSTNNVLNSIIQTVRETIKTVEKDLLLNPVEYEKTKKTSKENNSLIPRMAVIEITRHEYLTKLIANLTPQIELAMKLIKTCMLLYQSTDLKELKNFIQFIEFIANKQKMKSTPKKKAIYTLEIAEQDLKAELIETFNSIKKNRYFCPFLFY